MPRRRQEPLTQWQWDHGIRPMGWLGGTYGHYLGKWEFYEDQAADLRQMLLEQITPGEWDQIDRGKQIYKPHWDEKIHPNRTQGELEELKKWKQQRENS